MNLDHECTGPRWVGERRPGCSACKLEWRVRRYRWQLALTVTATTVLYMLGADLLGLPWLFWAWGVSITPAVCATSYLHWRRP